MLSQPQHVREGRSQRSPGTTTRVSNPHCNLIARDVSEILLVVAAVAAFGSAAGVDVQVSTIDKSRSHHNILLFLRESL